MIAARVRGGGRARLVDHQHVPRSQAQRLVAGAGGAGIEAVLGVEPGADVAGGDPLLGEHLGLALPVGDPEHPRAVTRAAAIGRGRRGLAGLGPGLGHGADQERLPGPGRRGEHLHRGAGGEDPAQRRGLVGAQLPASVGEASQHGVGLLGAPGGGAAPDRGVAQVLLAQQLVVRGEALRPGFDEHARPVGAVVALLEPRRPHRIGHHPRLAHGLVREPFQERPDLLRADPQVAREGIGDRAGQIRAGPGLLGVLHLLQRAGDHVALRPHRRLPRGVLGDRPGDLGEILAELLGVPVGPLGKLLVAGQTLVGLAPPGGQGGLFHQCGPLVPGRRPAVRLGERRDQLLRRGFDRGTALAEQLPGRRVDRGELAGLAVRAELPHRAELLPAPRLRAAVGVRAAGGLPLEQQRPVQRPPLPIRALGLVQDRAVRVQLRVPVAGVVLQKRRRHQAMGVHPLPGAAAVVPGAGVAGLVCVEVQQRPVPDHHRLLHDRGLARPLLGGVVVARGPDLVRRALERHPHHRQRLRRRKGRVVERHRLPRRLRGLSA
nr:hypothetical protein [Pseudonocardia sediminis]